MDERQRASPQQACKWSALLFPPNSCTLTEAYLGWNSHRAQKGLRELWSHNMSTCGLEWCRSAAGAYAKLYLRPFGYLPWVLWESSNWSHDTKLLMWRGPASSHGPLYFSFLLPKAQDQTKMSTAIMVGPVSCSEVDALCLISIAAFIGPSPHQMILVIEGKKKRGVLLWLPYAYEHV